MSVGKCWPPDFWEGFDFSSGAISIVSCWSGFFGRMAGVSKPGTFHEINDLLEIFKLRDTGILVLLDTRLKVRRLLFGGLRVSHNGSY